MASVTIDGNSLASIIAAVGAAGSAIITAITRRTTKVTESKVNDTATKVDTVQHAVADQAAKIEAVHSEVKTSNGHTLAELVEQNLAPTLDSSMAPVREAGTTAAGQVADVERA